MISNLFVVKKYDYPRKADVGQGHLGGRFSIYVKEAYKRSYCYALCLIQILATCTTVLFKKIKTAMEEIVLI